MSSNLFILSCKFIGTLLVLCFLKVASGFKGRCSDVLMNKLDQCQILMLRKLLNILVAVWLICQIRFAL